jgi:diguanylate cyclase (GGDEF)-like protein
LLDLDDFKTVNDRYGHPAGDQVLRLVAGRLRTAMAGRGIAARLSGDEFALIWHRQPTPDTLRHANTLLEKLSAPLNIDGHTIRTPASLGLARPGPYLHGTGLLAAADHAMYAAKHASRTAVTPTGQRPSSARVYASPYPPTPTDRRTTRRRADHTDAPTADSTTGASTTAEPGSHQGP